MSARFSELVAPDRVAAPTAALTRFDGALEVVGVTSERIGELAARHQIVLHELSTQQASLEEAFMQLTAESVEYHAHTGQAPAPPPEPQQAGGEGWRRS